MKREPLNSKNPVSRRSMLITSGAAVAAGALATSSAAAGVESESDYWKNLIGEKFTVNGAVYSDQRTRLALTLVGVEVMSKPDPNRPANCRTPFTLIFVPAPSRRPLQDATYYVNNRFAGRKALFINETRDQSYSKGPIVQAVFG